MRPGESTNNRKRKLSGLGALQTLVLELRHYRSNITTIQETGISSVMSIDLGCLRAATLDKGLGARALL